MTIRPMPQLNGTYFHMNQILRRWCNDSIDTSFANSNSPSFINSRVFLITGLPTVPVFRLFQSQFMCKMPRKFHFPTSSTNLQTHTIHVTWTGNFNKSVAFNISIWDWDINLKFPLNYELLKHIKVFLLQ